MEQLTGVVERITYHNEENGFSVIQVTSSSGKLVCVVGTLPAIQVGTTVQLQGEFKRHPQHGQQFEASSFEYEVPKEKKAIERFLSSGALRGIGPSFAKKIIDVFGTDSLQIIERDPQRLFEVKGLGRKKIENLLHCWKDQKVLQDVVLFLHSYGISKAYARRVVKTYGHQAVQKLKENPYQLAKQVHGIGFRHADSIAKHLGLQQDFPQRIEAGIDYAFYELVQEGHVCYPLDAFVKRAHEMLEIDPPLVESCLGRLLQAGDFEVRSFPHGTYIWSKPLFVSERGIAQELKRIVKTPAALREVDIEKAVQWVQERNHIHFAPIQKEAIAMVLKEKCTIITGGPGTGKSTITKAILTIYARLSHKIILAAPTGRAAKRLHEITRYNASTIHRILKFDFVTSQFKYHRDNPLDCDLLILDEASMIDTYLLYQLLRAIPSHTKIVIIGDVDQLPSVGPGKVLKDLIQSKTIATSILNVIFRQAQGSQIIVNAHRINEGKMPFLTTKKARSDFFFIEAQEQEEIKKIILDLVTKKVPEQWNYHPKHDLQVLAPMRKGLCGIEALNKELQAHINANNSGPALPTPLGTFRVGDKVMQLKNNYSKEVYNGDIGYITAIDQEQKNLIVTIDDREISYDFTDLDQLVLAYAVSVHKYQGSECPCIIMPIHTAHFKLLNKNLLYTAVTRGKKLVILVGSKKAIALSVHNKEDSLRHTGLEESLSSLFHQESGLETLS